MLVVHGLRVAPSKFKRGLTHGRRGASVSFSFDAYEYLAFVIPGSVLLLGLMVLFPWIREHIGPAAGTSFDLAGLGAFVIVSFVLGHLLQGLGSSLILGELLRGAESAYASNSVFKGDNKVLAAKVQESLETCIRDKLKISDLKKIPAVEPKKEASRLPATTSAKIVEAASADEAERAMRAELAKKEQEGLTVWRGVVSRIYSELRAQGRSKTAERFQRDHALHLQLTTAFILLALCVVFVWISQLVSPKLAKYLRVNETPQVLRALQLALLVAAAGIALIRMNRFDGLFARELYMTFINTCMPAVGG
jgi:hypothetical protein